MKDNNMHHVPVIQRALCKNIHEWTDNKLRTRKTFLIKIRIAWTVFIMTLLPITINLKHKINVMDVEINRWIPVRMPKLTQGDAEPSAPTGD